MSNLNGAELAKQFIAFGLNETPDFKLGGDRAILIACYGTGQLKDEHSNEHVREAKQLARALGSAEDRAAIMGLLMHNLVMEEIRKRFSE